jgi:hypothetical protein
VSDLGGGSIESAVDTMFANTIQTVTNGQRGPDQCFAKKLSAIAKKAQKFRSAGSGLHQPVRERTVRRRWRTCESHLPPLSLTNAEFQALRADPPRAVRSSAGGSLGCSRRPTRALRSSIGHDAREAGPPGRVPGLPTPRHRRGRSQVGLVGSGRALGRHRPGPGSARSLDAGDRRHRRVRSIVARRSRR